MRRLRQTHQTILVFILALALASGGSHLSLLRAKEAKHARPTYEHQELPILQGYVEKSLKDAISASNPSVASVLVIDASNGVINATAEYQATTGRVTSSDRMVTQSAWEPGSVMKPLLIASALNEGTIAPNTPIQNTKWLYAGGYNITNATDDVPDVFTIQDIVTKSINVGAVKVLASLGQQQSISLKAQHTWYEYLTERYHFNDGPGIITPPKDTAVSQRNYAEMAVGQRLTLTSMQLALAYAALVNDGTYNSSNVHDQQILKPLVSAQARKLLSTAFATNYTDKLRPGYTFGGKTGTAHMADLAGIYRDLGDAGSYIGFIHTGQKTYIMHVRMDKPETEGFASAAAVQTWQQIATGMIDTYGSFTGQ